MFTLVLPFSISKQMTCPCPLASYVMQLYSIYVNYPALLHLGIPKIQGTDINTQMKLSVCTEQQAGQSAPKCVSQITERIQRVQA